MGIKAIIYKVRPSSERGKLAEKNIYASLVLKVINIIISLIIVPVTINCVSSAQYGIWLTLSSIVIWLAYFDIGFGNGFRFRFTEAMANGDVCLARKYVSTTYALLTLIFGVLCVLCVVINNYINWASVLKLQFGLYETLRKTFTLLIILFCANFVMKTISTMLIADQRPALSDFINTLGQLFALGSIILFSHIGRIDLPMLVLLFTGIPCVVFLFSSFIIFSQKRYKQLYPAIKFIDFKLTKNIMNMGVKYFFTTCALFFILQLVNIIISRILGPDSVTQYNVIYKYYSALAMLFAIVVSPFWSAFTDAYTKRDYNWMKTVFKRLEHVLLIFLSFIIIMIALAPIAFNLWLGNKVVITILLSISMGFLISSQMFTTLYTSLINGTGKMRLQLYTDIVFAIISIPILTLSCRIYGLLGVILFLFIFHISLAMICRVQVLKIINEKAFGVWNK